MKIVLFLIVFAFLAAGCGDETDVNELESGIRYQDIEIGKGEEVKKGDLVEVNFDVWVVNDSVDLFSDWEKDSSKMMYNIGSSRESDQTLKFILGEGNFVKGVDEGIEGMKVGGERTIIIPSYLAYGKAGYGPIPPDTDLKVDVEVLEISEPAQMWEVDTGKIETTKSGLKYIIIDEGSGEKAESGDVVSVHYSGWLEDSTKFDSSVDRGMPLVFTLGKGMVIPGWDEGITLLKEGAKARLIIPPSLAYGDRQIPNIPPNSTLIFDVELVEVK